jgi:hypothetical protein
MSTWIRLCRINAHASTSPADAWSGNLENFYSRRGNILRFEASGYGQKSCSAVSNGPSELPTREDPMDETKGELLYSWLTS